MNPKDILIDVIGLSRQLCTHPIRGHLAYATSENFVGRIVNGYHSDAQEVCLLSQKAAKQLCLLQNSLISEELSLYIFDGFRPLRAVRDFSVWIDQSPNQYELERKELHYPYLNKADLPKLGYVSADISRHCFGHAVDLTLIKLNDETFLDMGTGFDYFDVTSHFDAKADSIGKDAYKNRQLLFEWMQQFGFIPYEFEWWHFDYQEREVDQPIDIEITSSLKGLGV